MKSILKISTLITAAALSAAAAPTAEQLFDTKCAVCHIKTRPADKSALIAPPVMGVMRHVKEHYGDKATAVAFISDYVMNPQRSKAVCMPRSIKRFGLMPSQKGAVTEAEVQQIAGWMYDNYPPQGMTGKSCQGSGSGKGKAGSGKRGKGGKPSVFLITKGLPHLTGMLMKHWDDPRLALTPKQKEKLLLVRQETMQGVKRIKPQAVKLEKQIRMLAREGAGNDRLDPMIDKLASLKAEASKIHIKCLNDTRAVLTPKQMQYLMSARQQRKAQ